MTEVADEVVARPMRTSDELDEARRLVADVFPWIHHRRALEYFREHACLRQRIEADFDQIATQYLMVR